MLLQENLAAVILCATAIISSCVALTAWVRRETTPSTRPFIRLMLAIAIYAAAAAGSEAANTIEILTLWTSLEYVASNSLIAFYLIFVLYFTGFKNWTTPRRRLFIWLVPVANVAKVLSDRWHGLIWQSMDLHPHNSHLNVIHHGPGYYWIAVCFYVYVVTSSALVLRSACRSSHLHQRQAIMIVAGSVPPQLAGTLFTLGLSPEHANILPMSFLLTGCIYFASLFKFRLLDLIPIARDTLIERLNDAVLVVNHENYVIDLNPAARRYTCPSKNCTGQHIDQEQLEWPEISAQCQAAANLTSTIVERPDIPLYVEMSVTHLRSSNSKCSRDSKVTGKILVLRDITQKHQTQLKIQRANDELEHQLTQIIYLRDQLKEQSIRDGLTGHFNRRYFEEPLPAELTKAPRANTPLSIVLMDIDYIKKVNDTYGHLAGDLALRTYAQIIQQHIRESDIACRYGGEEFILAMPNMPLIEANKRANDIRLALKAQQITFDQQSFQVTVSMGLCTFPETGTRQHALLKQIDQALSVAKANGRDRIEIATEKVAVISKLSELESAIAISRMQA